MSARGGGTRVAAALLALFAAGAVRASEEKSAPEKAPRIKPISLAGDAKAGERVYLETCWSCHGLSGDGRGPASGGMAPPPTDFTAPAAFREKSDGFLLDAILKGRAGTAMYPQGVDPQSAVDVLAYVKTLLRSPAEEKNLLEALARGDREAGRTIYNQRCWPCHGPTGRGNGPAAPALRPSPADFTDPDKVPARTSARLYAALSRGVPGTAMAAQSLSEKEKWDVIAYLRTLVRYADQPSADETEKPPGNPRAGKEIYERRCWACHGTSGDGNGPAADAMIPPPTRFADYDTMKTRSPQDWLRAIQSGVPGTAMYPQRLTEPEAWDLVAYLQTLGKKQPKTP
jgi:cytochrome c oxidase cbb3-type subunit III